MVPDSHIVLIGALLVLLNVLLYGILYFTTKKSKNEKDTSNHIRIADGDTLQRKSRDFRGIPAHFFAPADAASAAAQLDKLRIIRKHFGDIDDQTDSAAS